MNRPRILLDVDGVSADFITPCLDAIHAHTGRRFAPEDVTDWDIMKSLGIGTEDAIAIYKSMERPGLCMDIPVYPDAREGIASLREWADVWAVTAPFGGPHWMYERDRWLVERLGFHKSHVLHVRSEAKPGIVGDALVEDKTSTLKAWSAAHPNKRGVLFLRNYNQNDGWVGDFARDWTGLTMLLEHRLRA